MTDRTIASIHQQSRQHNRCGSNAPDFPLNTCFSHGKKTSPGSVKQILHSWSWTAAAAEAPAESAPMFGFSKKASLNAATSHPCLLSSRRYSKNEQDIQSGTHQETSASPLGPWAGDLVPSSMTATKKFWHLGKQMICTETKEAKNFAIAGGLG